jgi:hypothetical protein
MKLIKLTHANFKTALYVPTTQIAGFYHSPGSACTHVVASGGAVFPASESVETIQQLLGTSNVPANGPQDAAKE